MENASSMLANARLASTGDASGAAWGTVGGTGGKGRSGTTRGSHSKTREQLLCLVALASRTEDVRLRTADSNQLFKTCATLITNKFKQRH